MFKRSGFVIVVSVAAVVIAGLSASGCGSGQMRDELSAPSARTQGADSISGFGNESVAGEKRLPSGIPYSAIIDGRFLVRFKDGAKSASALEKHRNVSAVKTVRLDPFGIEYTLVKTSEGADAGDVYASLSSDPLVYDVTPDVIRTASFIPDDPLYPSTHLQTGQYFYEILQAERGWSVNAGSESVVVAIIDTGAQLTHDDLKNQLWVNTGEIPGNLLDDDDNDYFDDINGYDFYKVDGDPTDDDPLTGWHGTSIAGLVGAQGNNSTGIMGSAGGTGQVGQKGVRLMILRVGTDFSIGLSDELEAVAYAVLNGAKILNLSFGGEPGGDIEREVMDAAWLTGALIVAAGGNVGAGSSTTPLDWPAAIDSVICVGATNPVDVRASYSKAGPQMELVAPGTNLITTTGENKYTPQVSGEFTGTSGATALVSGLAALILSANPDFTNVQLRERLQNTAIDLGPPGGDEDYGFGRIDYATAMGFKESPASELTFDAEAGLLRWNYLNKGDYDLSGEVGIPDITPIAVHYEKLVSGGDPLIAWIDGDGNGEVGISDITVIALNYTRSVASYRLLTSANASGPFAEAGQVAFGDALPGNPRVYESPLPGGALRFFAVQSVDSSGIPGEISNVVDTQI